MLTCEGEGHQMRRREVLALLGSTATMSLPLTAHPQQTEALRRVGVLLPANAGDPEWQARHTAFQQGLAQLGWNIRRNVHIELRWGTAHAPEIRRHAVELVALAPDVILAGGT